MILWDFYFVSYEGNPDTTPAPVLSILNHVRVYSSYLYKWSPRHRLIYYTEPTIACMPLFITSDLLLYRPCHTMQRKGPFCCDFAASRSIADHRRPSQTIAGISSKIVGVWPGSCQRWNIFIFSCDGHRCDAN